MTDDGRRIPRAIPESLTPKSTLRITLAIAALVVCAVLSLIGYAAITRARAAAVEREARAKWSSLTALGTAVERGDVVGVRAALASGRGIDRGPALFIASRNGNTEIVKSLLSPEARFSPTDIQASLREAVQFGYADITKLLLDAGARADEPDASGFTPLHQAASSGFADVARELIQAGAEVDRPLQLPEQIRQIPSMNRLEGITALHLASLGRHPDTVKTLLDKGANPNRRSREGFTPISLCGYGLPPLPPRGIGTGGGGTPSIPRSNAIKKAVSRRVSRSAVQQLLLKAGATE